MKKPITVNRHISDNIIIERILAHPMNGTSAFLQIIFLHKKQDNNLSGTQNQQPLSTPV